MGKRRNHHRRHVVRAIEADKPPLEDDAGWRVGVGRTAYPPTPHGGDKISNLQIL